MEFLNLKGTDIRVPRLCVGGCPMGRYGWGEVSRQELIDAVHAALDMGLNFFDTADIYGLGESEKILGAALQGRRYKAVIISKFGVRRTSDGKTFYDNSPEWIEAALKGSLNRLKTDYIDVYQVHYLDGKTPLSAVVEILERFKKQGKIRTYGLSNIFLQDRNKIKTTGRFFSSFQNEYSLSQRVHEADILGLSNEFSMTPMTWGSLGQGILTGKYGADSRFSNNDRRARDIYINFHGKKLAHNLQIVTELRKIAEEHRVSIASVAIRWILDRIPESVVIAGIKRPQQLKANMDAFSWRLSDPEMDILDSVSK